MFSSTKNTSERHINLRNWLKKKKRKKQSEVQKCQGQVFFRKFSTKSVFRRTKRSGFQATTTDWKIGSGFWPSFPIPDSLLSSNWTRLRTPRTESWAPDFEKKEIFVTLKGIRSEPCRYVVVVVVIGYFVITAKAVLRLSIIFTFRSFWFISLIRVNS